MRFHAEPGDFTQEDLPLPVSNDDLQSKTIPAPRNPGLPAVFLIGELGLSPLGSPTPREGH